MPKKTKVECPECRGDRTVPGDRYTDGAKVCPTCKGAGTVPEEENDDGA